jgi:putative ABC transport system permease protein
VELVFADLKHACRTAAARPAFTLLVVTTLALGIGVNSAVFALLDGVLWRALPYRDPARLVFVWQTLPEHNVAELEPTPHDFASWRDLRSFESLALISSDAYTLTGDDDPERVRGARVTASLLPLLGLAPRVGRVFEPSEDQDSAAPTAILSDGLWKRRYGGDAAMVGRSILVNGVPTTVVGVMPPSALLPGPLAGNDDLWLPARMTPSERVNPVSHNYTVVARLAANVTVAGARAEIETFATRMAADEPASHHGLGARIVPFDEQTVRAVKPALLVVAGGVALLLLVACANASTLLIVRAASRRHETAVRAALGATQARLVSLAVCESLVLAVLGGVAGLTLGNWALNLLLPLFSNLLPPAAAIGVDHRVVLFATLLSGILGVAFGLATVTARRGLAFDSNEALSALKSSARTATADPAQARIRSVLVVAQIAFAVTLMSAAGLMLHSVVRLSRVSPGFDPSHLLTFRLSLAGGSYTEGAARDVFVRRFMERLGAVADIRQAALTSSLPFGGSRGANGVEIQGRPFTAGETIIIDQRHVTPGYFQAMRIALLRGRMLTATDDARAEPVVVINRSMADRYFPGSSAIDGRVRVTAGPNSAGWSRIVGVVDNVRHISLSRDPVPEM